MLFHMSIRPIVSVFPRMSVVTILALKIILFKLFFFKTPYILKFNIYIKIW